MPYSRPITASTSAENLARLLLLVREIHTPAAAAAAAAAAARKNTRTLEAQRAVDISTMPYATGELCLSKRIPLSHCDRQT